MKKYPDELAYNRSAAALEMNRENVEKARTILKAIIDKGKANESDLNLYAWYALLLPAPITDETIEIAHRGTDLSKNNFAIIHTLACVYAQAGKTSPARENLLKAMDAGQLDSPNSAVWLGFGLIAEQYGVMDAAERMYRRVEKDEFESTGSNYSIAQHHLMMLSSMTKPLVPTKR
jgi:tetratricopeptide (TPR) repeat protein